MTIYELVTVWCLTTLGLAAAFKFLADVIDPRDK